MTDIVRLQRKKKLPPEFIRLTAEFRAAGFSTGFSIGVNGVIEPARAAKLAGPTHKRVIKRNGTMAKWLKAINKRYGAWSRTYRA